MSYSGESMKSLLLIPTICLLCFACTPNSSSNNIATEEEQSSDWMITTKVKANILDDTTISTSARFVSVSTTNGVVTLKGSVPTKEDRSKIVKITKKVQGVISVNDQITISSK